MRSGLFRWTLIRRALWRKKAKALLIVLAITMGSSVVAGLLNLQADLRYRMNRELRDYGPNVFILPNSNTQDSVLSEDLLSALQTSSLQNRILAQSPQLFVPVKVNGRPAILVGADIEQLRVLYPNWEWKLSAGSTDNSVIAGARLAQRLGVTAGAEVRLEHSTTLSKLPLRGTIEGGEVEDERLYADLSFVQKLSGKPRNFHSIAISSLGEIQTVKSAFDTFAAQHPEIRYRLIRKIAAAETLILDKISKLMLLVVSLIFVILSFCIHTTVSAILLSRQGEIALYRVLGARRKQIMAGITLELMVLAFLGALLGFVTGIVMAQVLGRLLFQAYIVPRVSIFFITLFSSLFMVMVSSFIPIMRAVNQQAAIALKEA